MKKKTIDAALLTRAQDALAQRSAFNFVAKVSGASRETGKSWYNIVQSADAPDEADVLLYSEIGFWGIMAADFVRDLAGVTAKVINLRVNSPGGSVFDGLAIQAALAAHPAKIIAHVDGWAASIASVIIMAADEIRIGEAAQIMIHAPWSIVMGPAEDMRKKADVLDKIEQGIIDIYVARTGGDHEEIAAQVSAETWFKGQEAVDAGFADIMVPTKKKPKASANLGAEFFDIIFPNLPEDVRTDLRADSESAATGFNFSTATPREAEAFLRAHGATRKQATDAVVNNFKATPRDGGVNDRDARDERTNSTDGDAARSRDETVKAIQAAADLAAIRLSAASFKR